jgi:LacI family transcriptional regulator
MKSKPTMSDVAKRAGVSAATVARVIYKKGYVKAETKKSVESAVRETGYRPNVVARGLRTSRSFTMGLIVSEQRLSAFHPAVNHVIQSEAMKHGYAVLAFNSNGEIALEAAGVQRLLDHNVDAVIFCAAMDAANVHAVAQAGIPVVQIERELAEVGNVLTVDPAKGMQEAVDHLWELGHRCFAYIGGHPAHARSERRDYDSVEDLRERTFLDLLASKGVKPFPGFVTRSPYFEADSQSRQTAYDQMHDMLDASRTDISRTPTAVICGADVLAASALQAIADAGLRVPQDISVVGFDDSFARILTPALSSIAQPVQQTGQVAVEMALQSINVPVSSPQRRVLSTNFVSRSSTASPPG